MWSGCHCCVMIFTNSLIYIQALFFPAIQHLVYFLLVTEHFLRAGVLCLFSLFPFENVFMAHYGLADIALYSLHNGTTITTATRLYLIVSAHILHLFTKLKCFQVGNNWSIGRSNRAGLNFFCAICKHFMSYNWGWISSSRRSCINAFSINYSSTQNKTKPIKLTIWFLSSMPKLKIARNDKWKGGEN